MKKAKEEELVRCGKELQKDFLGNRRKLWKKMKGKDEVHKIGLGIKSEGGALLTELEEVKIRWKNYLRGLFEGEVSGVDMRRVSV